MLIRIFLLGPSSVDTVGFLLVGNFATLFLPMMGTAAPHFIPPHIEVPGEMNICESCASGDAGALWLVSGGVGSPLDGLDSGVAGGFFDRAFAGVAGGIWRSGAGGSWKRVC